MASPAADEKCAVVAVNSTDAVENASLFPADNGTGATVNNKTLFVNVVSFF
jgi:hypothetical protein